MKNQIRSLRRRWQTRRSGRLVARRSGLAWGVERLEGRALLAADWLGSPFHNPQLPEDVNGDLRVTPADALLVVNALNRMGGTSTLSTLAEGEGDLPRFVDVNGDGFLTPVDALMVINRLNEGENGPKEVEIRLQPREALPSPFPKEGLHENLDFIGGVPITEIHAGQEFIVRATVQDIRDMPQGVGAVFMDILYQQEKISVVPGVSTDRLPDRELNFSISYFDHNNPFSAPWPYSDGITGTSVPAIGLIDEVGGFTQTLFGGQEKYVFEVLFQAGTFTVQNDQFQVQQGQTQPLDVLANDQLISGLAELVSDPADDVRPEENVFGPSEIIVFDDPQPRKVFASQVIYGDAGVSIVNEGSLQITGISNVSAGGTVNIVDDGARLSYTPAAGFSGTETFVYTVEYTGVGGLTVTKQGTVSVEVAQVNQPPSHVVPGPQTIDEDQVLVFTGGQQITVSDPDAGGEQVETQLSVTQGQLTLATTAGLTFTQGDGVADAAMTFRGTLASINAALDGMTYAPPQQFQGTSLLATLTITTNDLGHTGIGPVGEATDTVAITVEAINHAPQIGLPPSQVVDENEQLVFSVATANAITISDVDAGAGELDVSLTVSEGHLALATTAGLTILEGDPAMDDSLFFRGTLTALNAALDGMTYTPPASFIGSVTLDVFVDDRGHTGKPGPLEADAELIIDVVPLARPRARNDAFTVDEDSAFDDAANRFDVLANDLGNPGFELRITAVTQPPAGEGVVEIREDDTVIVFQPAADFFGTTSFTYTIEDDFPESLPSTATVVVTVLEINDPPVADDFSVSTDEDTPLTIPQATFLANAVAGPPNEQAVQTLTVISVEALTPQFGSVTLDAATGAVLFTPAQDFNDAWGEGSFQFRYTVQDDGTTRGVPDPLTDSAVVTVNVFPVNDPPVPADPFFLRIAEGTQLVLSASELEQAGSPGGGPDEAGQELSVTAVSTTSAAGGTVVLSGGAITYTPPDAHFNGLDTFTYTLLDDGAPPASAQGTVTIEVWEVNDPPITSPVETTAIRNVAKSIPVSELLVGDVPGPPNESNQVLAVTEVRATADTNGTVELVGGVVIYTPAVDFTGSASFEYVVTDNGTTDGQPDPLSAVGTVFVTVLDFVPSDFSGVVYVDANDNGLPDDDEMRLSGVTVHLTGHDRISDAEVALSAETDANGYFEFMGLPPGNYTIHSPQLEFFKDGKSTTLVPTTSPDGWRLVEFENDRFTVDISLEGGTSVVVDSNLPGSGLNFGKRGLTGEFLTLEDFTTLVPTHGLVFGLHGDTNDWFGRLSGWDGIRSANVTLSSDLQTATLRIVDAGGTERTTSFSTRDYERFRFGGTDDQGRRVVTVVGTLEDFFPGLNNFSAVEGEADYAQLAAAMAGDEPYADAADAVFADESWA